MDIFRSFFPLGRFGCYTIGSVGHYCVYTITTFVLTTRKGIIMGEDGWAFDVLKGFGRFNTGDDDRRGARRAEPTYEEYEFGDEYLDDEE